MEESVKKLAEELAKLTEEDSYKLAIEVHNHPTLVVGVKPLTAGDPPTCKQGWTWNGTMCVPDLG